jgi:2-polyprenyl-3-methyl-5-hydroxy-6-metoxy-1,4-benzoquinol methylase
MNDGPPSRMLRAKLAATRKRIKTAEWCDAKLVEVGSALASIGRNSILRVHRGEEIDLPTPITIGGTTFDITDDLVRYTGLARNVVEQLLQRRLDSFRAEWFMTPPAQRTDDWFYLASGTYIFGNAAHDPRPLLELVSAGVEAPGFALDFGGGSGNLALALAASNWTVDYVERSALQKDFVAFRADRYDLGDRLRILKHWQPLPTSAYDLLCAVDVLEHIEHLGALMRDVLIPAIKPKGILVEASPFTRNLSNPMHHEHRDFDDIMRAGRFVVNDARSPIRIWRRP